MAKKARRAKLEVVNVAQQTGSELIEALNDHELHEFEQCEKVIKKGWDTFVDVGVALAKIQKGKLYRATAPTFEAYCRLRWQYGKSQAYRLIGAAQVIEHLSPIGDGIPLPINEAQVRPLIGLQADEQIRVWKEAIEKAGEKGVTAKIVREAAAPYQPATEVKKPADKQRKSKLAPALKKLDEAIEALSSEDTQKATGILESLRTYLSKVG